ncbi:MAG: hypothetical protein ACKESB_02585, partial [Candidatus Hodgkinia cicadicola]
LGTSVLNDLEFVAFISRRYPDWTTVSGFDYELVTEWFWSLTFVLQFWMDVNRNGAMCAATLSFCQK